MYSQTKPCSLKFIVVLAAAILARSIAQSADSQSAVSSAADLQASDVDHLQIVVEYSAPMTYTVTHAVPVREIVLGLRESLVIRKEMECRESEPKCTLLLFAKEKGTNALVEYSLGVTGGLVPVCLGEVGAEGRVEVSARLKNILSVILARLTERNPAATDADLPGGFRSDEVPLAAMTGGTDLGLLVLDAIVHGYGEKSDLSEAEKADQAWASTWRATLVHKSKKSAGDIAAYAERVTADLNDFLASTRHDRSVSTEFGGLPYGIMVEIKTHFSLGGFYQRADMYEKAISEYERLSEAITPEAIEMATNAPNDRTPMVWQKDSARGSLEWLKTQYIPKSIAECEAALRGAVVD